MAGSTAQLPNQQNETPAWMLWQFSDDGGSIVPKFSLDDEASRETVFEAYDVDSLEDLEDELLPNSHAVDTLRLGVFFGEKGDATFHTETELLATVDGISEELAAGLIDECRDIPTLCKRRRHDGDVFLGDLRHDMEVQGVDWLDELDALIDELDDRDNLERRLKDAGIWVEPQNETAGL
jgi:hypothetical protein